MRTRPERTSSTQSAVPPCSKITDPAGYVPGSPISSSASLSAGVSAWRNSVSLKVPEG
jgi:hypothetical protein